MGWYGVITNQGRQMINNFAAGLSILNINGVKIGSGEITVTPSYEGEDVTEQVRSLMRQATDLRVYKDDGAIIQRKNLESGVKFSLQFGAHNGSAYIAKEIGLYANGTDGEEQLMVLFQHDFGVQIPSKALNPDFVMVLGTVVVMDNVEDVTINISMDAYVTYEYLSAVQAQIDADLSRKVDKREGYGLSQNDYTNDEKDKLAGIEEQANRYILPAASNVRLGGIKVGANLAIDTNGVLRAVIPENPVMRGATSSAAGVRGLVPDPGAGKHNSYLRGDGQWMVPTNTTYGAGAGMSLSGTNFVNAGVRSVAEGSANGTISVNTNGTAANVAVHGLKSAAYAETSAFAAASHNHAAGNITSGVLPIARGGTGLSSSPSMLTNLASTSAANVMTASPRPGVTGVLSLANGGTGTGLSQNPSVLVNLGSGSADTAFKAAPRPGVTGTLGIGNGGTGMTSNPSLLVNLGSGSAASVFAASPRPGITGKLAVGHGGTGLTSSPSMLVNLASGSAASVLVASPRPGVTGKLGIGNGGTNADNIRDAKRNLGLPRAVGYYNGNGGYKHKITLGFKPDQVFITSFDHRPLSDGMYGTDTICFWPGHNLVSQDVAYDITTSGDTLYAAANNGNVLAAIMSDGFFVNTNTLCVNGVRGTWVGHYLYFAW